MMRFEFCLYSTQKYLIVHEIIALHLPPCSKLFNRMKITRLSNGPHFSNWLQTNLFANSSYEFHTRNLVYLWKYKLAGKNVHIILMCKNTLRKLINVSHWEEINMQNNFRQFVIWLLIKLYWKVWKYCVIWFWAWLNHWRCSRDPRSL